MPVACQIRAPTWSDGGGAARVGEPVNFRWSAHHESGTGQGHCANSEHGWQ